MAAAAVVPDYSGGTAVELHHLPSWPPHGETGIANNSIVKRQGGSTPEVSVVSEAEGLVKAPVGFLLPTGCSSRADVPFRRETWVFNVFEGAELEQPRPEERGGMLVRRWIGGAQREPGAGAERGSRLHSVSLLGAALTHGE